MSDRRVLRLVSQYTPTPVAHAIRDNLFAAFADSGTYALAGLLAARHPVATLGTMLKRRRLVFAYTKDGLELDLFLPASASLSSPRPILLFVHGGAWGSGKRFFYSLFAQRLAEEADVLVACIDYHKYPKGTASQQVLNAADAVSWLQHHGAKYGGDVSRGVLLCGHSSGAHICASLMLRVAAEDPALAPLSLRIAGFIGLAGVYDTCEHYLYEAWRGVHELSPLKPANAPQGRAELLPPLPPFPLYPPPHIAALPLAGRTGVVMTGSTICLPLDNATANSSSSAAPRCPHRPDAAALCSAAATRHRSVSCFESSSPLHMLQHLSMEQALALPPVLLLHGSKDKTVPPEGSERFARALVAAKGRWEERAALCSSCPSSSCCCSLRHRYLEVDGRLTGVECDAAMPYDHGSIVLDAMLGREAEASHMLRRVRAFCARAATGPGAGPGELVPLVAKL